MSPLTGRGQHTHIPSVPNGAPEMPRTFAQIEAELEAMPVTSMKYRLLQALYDGRLTDGVRPDSPEKSK